ncbi:hypothetical protein CSB69_1088 [Morganella morganii]|nr:hypothetical protein CSB69_1088 [Morganella morganii]
MIQHSKQWPKSKAISRRFHYTVSLFACSPLCADNGNKA